MVIMKSKEWIIAVKLELIYSKKEILTMYANTVDFGNNSFGVKTAAKPTSTPPCGDDHRPSSHISRYAEGYNL